MRHEPPRTPSRAILVVTLLLIQGCLQPVHITLDQGSAGTDVSFIGEGTTRAEVESVLGEPVERQSLNGETLDTYAFKASLGPAGVTLEPMIPAVLGLTRIPVIPLAVPEVDWISDTAYATVTYGSDDTVLGIVGAFNREGAQEVKKLRVQAKGGKPEAQYELAGLSLSGSSERWKWYCYAAVQGHAKAQFEIGTYFELGVSPAERDFVKAYLWYNEAAENGATAKVFFGYDRRSLTKTDTVLEQMTSEQITVAKRLAAEWEPDPAVCETIHPSALQGS